MVRRAADAYTNMTFETLDQLSDFIANAITHYRSGQRCAAIFPASGMKHSQDDPSRSQRTPTSCARRTADFGAGASDATAPS